jgi:hypothetical protein
MVLGTGYKKKKATDIKLYLLKGSVMGPTQQNGLILNQLSLLRGPGMGVNKWALYNGCQKENLEGKGGAGSGFEASKRQRSWEAQKGDWDCVYETGITSASSMTRNPTWLPEFERISWKQCW